MTGACRTALTGRPAADWYCGEWVLTPSRLKPNPSLLTEGPGKSGTAWARMHLEIQGLRELALLLQHRWGIGGCGAVREGAGLFMRSHGVPSYPDPDNHPCSRPVDTMNCGPGR